MIFVAIDAVAEMRCQINNREARIGVVGMGYVGLPLTLLFSEERFADTGFDINSAKVEALNKGTSYIIRIPRTKPHSAQRNGFRATVDHREIARMDVVLLRLFKNRVRSSFSHRHP